MLEYDYTEPQKIIPEATNPMRPVEYGLSADCKMLIIRQTVKTSGLDMGGYPVDTKQLELSSKDADTINAIIKATMEGNAQFKNVTVKAVS